MKVTSRYGEEGGGQSGSLLVSLSVVRSDPKILLPLAPGQGPGMSLNSPGSEYHLLYEAVLQRNICSPC